jgi:hypothetical protein
VVGRIIDQHVKQVVVGGKLLSVSFHNTSEPVTLSKGSAPITDVGYATTTVTGGAFLI